LQKKSGKNREKAIRSKGKWGSSRGKKEESASQLKSSKLALKGGPREKKCSPERMKGFRKGYWSQAEME